MTTKATTKRYLRRNRWLSGKLRDALCEHDTFQDRIVSASLICWMAAQQNISPGALSPKEAESLFDSLRVLATQSRDIDGLKPNQDIGQTSIGRRWKQVRRRALCRFLNHVPSTGLDTAIGEVALFLVLLAQDYGEPRVRPESYRPLIDSTIRIAWSEGWTPEDFTHPEGIEALGMYMYCVATGTWEQDIPVISSNHRPPDPSAWRWHRVQTRAATLLSAGLVEADKDPVREFFKDLKRKKAKTR